MHREEERIHIVHIPAGGEAVIEADPDSPETVLLVENPKRPISLARLIHRVSNPIRRLMRRRRRRNIAGYKDEEGVFHPIRWDPEYDYRLAGEPREYATNNALSEEEVRLYMRRGRGRAARRRTRATARRRTRATARRRRR